MSHSVSVPAKKSIQTKISRAKTKLAQAKPSFPVRRMDYEFAAMPRYWFANEPSLTHLFTGMSTLFPEGESYFVRSVRALRKQIKDNPQLDKDIGAFIGQEAMHSKEHHAFHQSAEQFGLDPASLENATGLILKTLEKLLSKKANLLLTVGLEHYTAVLVVTMMDSVNELMTDDTVRNLWLWHSVEETEHKAVAFDMYQHLYGSGLNAYLPRIMIFSFALLMITSMMIGYTTVLMKRDKQLLNLRSWKKLGQMMVSSHKIFIPKFLDYYRPDFHPNDTDESELVAKTKAKLGLLKPADALAC
ncbi:metal-dependent hydrolase [Alkanindiges illinoisensis]|uniref:metal-dependent hydrolase n=1 Tax=Alkanindiges illinoisensis TaxID=197183 RepID=UPI0009FCE013